MVIIVNDMDIIDVSDNNFEPKKKKDKFMMGIYISARTAAK